jgi:guanylate kinase
MSSDAAHPKAVTGKLFIISAPSGAGKTTLCADIRRHFPALLYSISYTTRPPRHGEEEGRDYFFISRSEFEKGITEGRWAEWAKVHGHYYGTSARLIQEALELGKAILMDIDVQGTRQILDRFPEAVTIFIMPPSLAELDRRLRLRGTDDDATIAVRLNNARMEIAQGRDYRHIIVNDELDQARKQILSVFEKYLH